MPQNAEISFYATPAMPMTSRQVAAPGAPDQMEADGWLKHATRRVLQQSRKGWRGVYEKKDVLLKPCQGLQAPQSAVKMENKGRHDGRLPAH
jgi:hypothetical protein